MIGQMEMPADFKYRDIFIKGKPVHDRHDDFTVRHPKMDMSRRAKIFSPFDALKSINSKYQAENG